MPGMRFEEINPPACPPKGVAEEKAKPKAKAKPKEEKKANPLKVVPNPLKKSDS